MRPAKCYGAAAASIEELSAAIARRLDGGSRVRAVGWRHSFSDVACTATARWSASTAWRECSTSTPPRASARPVGITIRELSRRLDEHGLAFENLGDIDVQTISGAISTATHGTGARLRNISSQVVELTLVRSPTARRSSARPGATRTSSARPASGGSALASSPR